MLELALLTLASVWDNGHNRTLFNMDRDPYDPHVEFTGDGSAYMAGKGVMSLTGFAPRYRVLENFHDVEITIYAKRISEAKQLDFAGFQIGARSHHYTDATCGANTYYGQLTYDGRVSFEKELFHGLGDDAFYPDVHDNGAQQYAFDGVPYDKWIGLRFVVKSADNNTAALLQLYLDKDDTGAWQKVLEYKDDGHWPVTTGKRNMNKICDGYYPRDKVLTEPGFVFIRNDGLGRADYRGLVIKEI
jgi:hypothetical protein